MEKPFKKSKLEFGNQAKDRLKQYAIDLDRDIFNLFQYVMNFPKVYSQNTIPTIPNDTIALWHDTLNAKYYWIVNIDGTQKKVELT